MRVPKLSAGLLSAGLALAALPAAGEDLTIVFKTDKGTQQAQYYTSTKARTNMGDRDSIMDFATGSITTIDHKKKEYSQFTLDQMEAAMKQASAQMEQAMAKVPPEMRAQMEKMMGGAMGDITITKGGTKKVAGYDAQQYTVTMGENMSTEIWATTAIQWPFDPAQFRKMSGFSMPGGPMMKNAAKMAEKMKEVQGFTLADAVSFKMAGRTTVTSKEAVEVKKGPIPAETFAVPAGYKKVESPMLKMGQMGAPQ
jgi:Domain of unknown function (DUF4412)